ncbi:MAG TPA: carboxypeptidase regulatory-like domain-containing protein [Longimicrobiales bacterium]|nr:carboxypeptidase regulatory-like domain-containing protein [Longimicrobiales bacterium]
MLTGRVIGPDGAPLAGARVEALSVSTELTRAAGTDGAGRYLILFPDGGGLYVLRFTFLGMADTVAVSERQPDEELMVLHMRMRSRPIALDSLRVQGTAAPGADADGDPLVLTQELLLQLPLEDLHPSTLARLAAGVTITDADSLTERVGFSVGGMSDALNQVTLDGISLGETPVDVPEEGLRSAEVRTSTYDASRGGFAGGQVAMTSARGNNRSTGSLTYRLDDNTLQFRATPTTQAFSRHNLGGSWGGPLRRDQFFYNVSFQWTRNVEHRYALAADDPLATQRSGVALDSIARFLDILQAYGTFPTDGQTGPYQQLSHDVRLQSRLDWNIIRSDAHTQSLSLRTNLSLNSQDSTRINTLDLMQHGGEQARNVGQAALKLTSKFGTRWTNTLDLMFRESWSEALPYIEMPQAQVRVTSEFDDGTRGSRTLVFGGNRNMPTDAFGRDFEFGNELGLVLHAGEQVHRLKGGLSIERSRSISRSTSNLFGSFRYGSLQDLADNRPDRYERTITEREAESGRTSIGLHVGDTWKVSAPLELTLGMRWDYSRLAQRPDYNPVVDSTLGRRTDIVPRSAAVSPRLGFTYRLQAPRGVRRQVSGGIGYFAGRAPTNIFSTAVRQTGLPNAEQSVLCIGDAVPAADWEHYVNNPLGAPVDCADGAPGAPAQSSRAPTVTLIDPDQAMPASLRLDISYRTRLPFLGLDGTFQYMHSYGRGLWSYRDLNLDETTTHRLGPDNRLFFGDPTAITPSRGTVSLISSRLFDEFTHVYDVTSSLRSFSNQFTTQVSGTLPRRVRVSSSHTLSFIRDQGSGSLQAMTTAGNPNIPEWATASNERRHAVRLQLTWPATPSIEFSGTTRLTSGAPFTPMVNRDVNGDGLRNDRAFVFNPAVTQDTALANGMARLLDIVPGHVRQCIRAQFGTFARRNSCRNRWTQSLDLRVNARPDLPGLDRRLTLTADIRNVLTGLDVLIHGRDDMRGWGEGQRADVNLLEVQSFDRANGAFRYTVNEGFGQDLRGPNAFRNAFSVTISGRMTLGQGETGRPYFTRPASND